MKCSMFTNLFKVNSNEILSVKSNSINFFSDSTHEMIVKIMKGDKNFRDTTKSETQCSNEVYIYKEVLPCLKKFVANSGSSLSTDWCPRVYYADFKVFPELSKEKETILAMENLKPLKYRLGPRIDLDEAHLRIMIKNIASYHSVQYAMKIRKDPMLEGLAKGLVPFSFLDNKGELLESYNILFSVGLKRFFNLVFNDPKYDQKFVEVVKKLKDNYGERPSFLMQSFLKYDENFSLVLHGDYNRNNVLFQYDAAEGYENPKNIKMFDFQETRFATPVIDVFFFLYMNCPASLRPRIWDSLLELYHETLISSLSELLKCDKNDPKLEPYSRDNVMAHFKKSAFYGVMIGIHFIPWMACPEEECAELSRLFETDIQALAQSELIQTCGGKDVDNRITSIAVHAFEKGYMDIFK